MSAIVPSQCGKVRSIPLPAAFCRVGNSVAEYDLGKSGACALAGGPCGEAACGVGFPNPGAAQSPNAFNAALS